jgi:hypothetical protein
LIQDLGTGRPVWATRVRAETRIQAIDQLLHRWRTRENTARRQDERVVERQREQRIGR